ncbi:MAG: BlaI/MecI/CopY family transcriptional regulator [Acidobacteriota bacterium]
MKLPRVTLRGFRPTARGINQVLGELEADVINVLWQQPNQTVVEVEERLRRKREIAHTTVLTTLDRMHRKGYLSREKQGKAFLYSPRYTREEFERALAQEVLSALLGGLGEPVLSTFVDLVGEDSAKLNQLEALIKQRREGRK